MFTLIEPSEVGTLGLCWLLLSYGYVLYFASNLISEGSELLLLVPSLAGLVGGVVLPLLGAVPDGAIILFSGLGENAQETLSVGIGALAGSTIMLLTVPFALSVYGGRVDIIDGTPNYTKKPKLSSTQSNVLRHLTHTGVAITDPVKHGGTMMVATTIPYFLIQLRAIFLQSNGDDDVDIAAGEKWWALVGFIICLFGLLLYMSMQLKFSADGADRDKRVAVTKKLLKEGRVSLSGAVASQVREAERTPTATTEVDTAGNEGASSYKVMGIDGTRQSGATTSGHNQPPPEVAAYLSELLGSAYNEYDSNGNGQLDQHECYIFFRDFHEAITEDEMKELFELHDTDKSGYICFNEFIGLAYSLIKAQEVKQPHHHGSARSSNARAAIAEGAFADGGGDDDEEIPDEFTNMSPDEQQRAIKIRAFFMLLAGATLVVLFSDPIVDVFSEVAERSNIPSFYVSFILAPLASNLMEVLSSMYYASKKTRKTITVSLTALEGAACMNNTFCLSIFMGLIFFRGLAWSYSAETLAIVLVQLIIGAMAQKATLTFGVSIFILLIFPLSIVLVAGLEALGFD